MDDLDCKTDGRACTKCGEFKLFNSFGNQPKGRWGKNSQCNECIKEYRKDNYARLRKYWTDRQRRVRAEERADRIVYTVPYPDTMKPCSRCKKLKSKADFHVMSKQTGDLQRQCKSCKAELSKSYNAKPESAEKRNSTRNTRRRNNPDRSRKEYSKDYQRRLAKHGNMLLLRSRISSGLRRSLSNGGKAGRSAYDLVDFTPDELKVHLEKQFLDGMGWHNLNEWDIDHIVPLSSFTFSSVDDQNFKRAWALPNLRPLWSVDNRRKCATRTHLI